LCLATTVGRPSSTLSLLGFASIATGNSGEFRGSSRLRSSCRRFVAALAESRCGLLLCLASVPLAAFFLSESLHPREILSQVRREVWLWAPVLAGSAILISIILATRERSLVLDPPPIFAGIQNIPRNLLSYLVYFCFPLPLAAVWAASRWNTRPRRVAYALLTGAFVGARARPGRTRRHVLGGDRL
jgi:hypothetical protein